MANTYYVSGLVGDDTYNGLGPDASHASNKPFKTLDKALSSTLSGSDDIIHVGPGINRPASNGANTVDTSGTSGHPIIIRGDPLNKQGFKDGSGVLLSSAPALVTVYAADNSGSAYPALVAVSKAYYTVEDLWLEGGSNSLSLTGTSNHFTFTRCYFTVGDGNSVAISITPNADVVIADTFTNCIVYAVGGEAMFITLTALYTADADMATTISNCKLYGVTGVRLLYTNGHTYNAGGITVVNNVIYGGSYGIYCRYAKSATTYPIIFVNNCVNASANAIGAADIGGGATDWISNSYNLLWATTPRTGAAVGTGEIALSSSNDGITRFSFGCEEIWGLPRRPIFAPFLDCQHWDAGSNSYGGTTDILGRVAPSGTGSTTKQMGCYANHDYGTKDTATKDAGDASVKLVGPGDHEFLIAVAAESTTISIKVRYDSGTYGGTDYPQAILLDTEGFANIGGNTETETATVAASDAWETLTFTAFTPSRKGTVRLRLVNRGTGADDVCWFDTLGIA